MFPSLLTRAISSTRNDKRREGTRKVGHEQEEPITNYRVSNNLFSRAFTVTLINSKKRLLISIYIYTLKNW